MALRPTLVVLNATTNDLAASYSVDETMTNLLAIRAVAEAGGARVVMLSTQPRDLSDAGRAQLPVIDAGLASAFGDCFVDIRTPLANADGRLLPTYDSGDGIHPNDAGHAVIFQRVDAALQSGRCVAPPR
jgi:lysophospholipase L1-like esterase